MFFFLKNILKNPVILKLYFGSEPGKTFLLLVLILII